MYFTQNTRDYGLVSNAVQPLYCSRSVSIFYDVGVTKLTKPYSLIKIIVSFNIFINLISTKMLYFLAV